MKPAVLLTHLRSCDEMAESLLLHADVDIIVAYDEVLPYFESRGVPCKRLFDFLSETRSQRAVVEAAVRFDALRHRFNEEVMERYWPHWDAGLRQRVAERLIEQMKGDLYQETTFVEALRSCAAQTDLRLIIVPQDICRDTKTMAMVARRLGIPVLHLLHAFPYGADNLHEECYADAIAVFSERARDLYRGFGVPEDRIVVTGNPYWDNFWRPPRPGLREKGFEASGLDPKQPVIVVGLTYPHQLSAISAAHPDYVRQTCEATLDALGTLCRKYPEWQVILRPHPNVPAHIEDLDDKAHSAGIQHVWVDSKLASTTVCSMASLVMCTQSNLGIEAMFLGVPVINLVLEEFAQPVFAEGMGPLFVDEDAILSVWRVGDIAPAIEGLMRDPKERDALLNKRKDTILRYNGFLDGRSSERFTALARKMMNMPLESLPKTDRFEAWEGPLAQAVPDDASRVLLLGRFTRSLAGAVEVAVPSARVLAGRDGAAVAQAGFDVVVLADPLTPDSRSQDEIEAAAQWLAPGGGLIACAQHGAYADAVESLNAAAWAPPRPGAECATQLHGFSRQGLEMVFSRAGFDIREWLPRVNIAMVENIECSAHEQAIEGWVVRAVKRNGARHFGSGQSDTAAALNEKGEALFAEGDYEGARKAFEGALRLEPRRALYDNNLAAVLFALGEHDAAWNALVRTLEHEPQLESARANLRDVAQVLGREAEAARILEGR